MITSFLVFRTKIFRLFTFICVYAFFQDFLKTRFGVTQGKRVLRSRVVAVIKEQYDVNVSAPIVGRLCWQHLVVVRHAVMGYSKKQEHQGMIHSILMGLSILMTARSLGREVSEQLSIEQRD